MDYWEDCVEVIPNVVWREPVLPPAPPPAKLSMGTWMLDSEGVCAHCGEACLRWDAIRCVVLHGKCKVGYDNEEVV